MRWTTDADTRVAVGLPGVRSPAEHVGHVLGELLLLADVREALTNPALGVAVDHGDHDDAMDAMQKAFIRIHRSLKRFRIDEPFFPWFYRIVRNTAHNQRRDEKRHKGEMPLEWVKQSDGRPDPLSETVADDLRGRVMGAQCGLDAWALAQRYWDGSARD